jgi:hypothetical protein
MKALVFETDYYPEEKVAKLNHNFSGCAYNFNFFVADTTIQKDRTSYKIMVESDGFCSVEELRAEVLMSALTYIISFC